METITVTLPSETYHLLEEQARRAGKKPTQILVELLEEAMKKKRKGFSKTARSAVHILAASDRLRTLSPHLQSKIIPDVSLKDVKATLQKAGSKSLSDIIIEQRGSLTHE